MRFNEMAAFAPLVLLAILMGVYPSLFLDPMTASVDNLVSQIAADMAPAQPAIPPPWPRPRTEPGMIA